jgi:hypothetical protein
MSRKFLGGVPGLRSLKSGFRDLSQPDCLCTSLSDGDGRTSTRATVTVDVETARPASFRTLLMTRSFPDRFSSALPTTLSDSGTADSDASPVQRTPVMFRIPISSPTTASRSPTNRNGCCMISTAKALQVSRASLRYLSSSRSAERRRRLRAITPFTDGVDESVPPFKRSRGPGTPSIGLDDVV